MFTLSYALCCLLIPSITRRQAKEISMRSGCRSVFFFLLMGIQKSRVGRTWRPITQVGALRHPMYQFVWFPSHLVRLLGIRGLVLRVVNAPRSYSERTSPGWN
ncbi:hypothetical protein AVEN_161436-1 [Araneus ventricosus]|uniref:Secreted protein n=1 Tax=Araneus ventricosus TaxID=182803 RepID=A0A4Y2M530_ARAVE|nr:hypothetical protein AVEN_161436-1 [Araneus ventricosus]